MGSKALEDWANVRYAELGYMLQEMHDASHRGEVVVLPEMLTYAIANMIGQVILSRRVFVTVGREVNEFKEMVLELVTSAGLFNIGDFVPWLGWLDLQKIERGMKKLHTKFDVLISRMLDDHAHQRKAKLDFLDALLANRDSIEGEGERLTTTNIKALLLNLFTAGTDTTSSVIEWALTEMIKNPAILNKAHQEMDRVIGKHRQLLESDIPNLPYLQAICKESFRKHPHTPLNLPRVSADACVVNGYYIPKNTRLSVNIWAIGRDPEVWENPLEFIPERFLSGKNEKTDLRGNMSFDFMPFGAGRRICAGRMMGMVLVEYILGTLVHSFDWGMPPGTAEMDMEESFGIALHKAVPLAAIVTPRLPNNCYAP